MTSNAGKDKSCPELPHRAEDFVPHRPPMLVVSALLTRQDDNATAEAHIPAKGFFISTGNKLLPEYYIEAVAQTMAAANGYDAYSDLENKKKQRYLVGIDSFEWHSEAAPGTVATVSIEKKFQFGSVTILEGQVRQDELLLASGTLKVWEE